MNFRILTVIAIVALGTSSGADAASECTTFTNAFNSYMTLAQNNNYFTMTQPLASTQAASDVILSQFAAFINTMQSTFNSYSPMPTCPAYVQALPILTSAQQEYAVLASFNGPYVMPAANGGTAAVTNFITLALPCSTNGSPAGLRPCSQVEPDFVSSLQTQLAKIAQLDYSGGATVDASGNIIPTPSSNPVCVPEAGLTGIANSAPEISTNMDGQSCGAFTQYSMSIQGKSCIPTAPSSSAPGDLGTLPDGEVSGMNIYGLDCAFAQMKNEITSGAGIKLSAAQGLTPQQLYNNQLNGVSGYYSGYYSQLKSFINQPNLSQIELCDPLTANPQTQQTPAYQSACQLFNERSAIESMYLHLAELELSFRDQRSFDSFLYGYDGTNIFTQFQAYLQSQAHQGGQCWGKSSDCNTASYISGCLQPSWTTFFGQQFNRVFPAGVCQ
jgi:hypothetical protein